MPEAPKPLALTLYRALGSIMGWPFTPLMLAYRVSRGKEVRARLGERYGRASAPRPEGSVVWIHAASVGETNAVMPLIRRLTATGRSVVFTTITVTAAKVASEKLPPGAVHQFSPIDIRRYVRAFLDHWRPDMAMFVESELWPEAIVTLEEKGIPLTVINGRLSQRSFEGWKRHEKVAAAIFSRISVCLAQSEKDAERYASLGVPNVSVSGNLKFDSPLLGVIPDAMEDLAAQIADRPAWLAASTHHGEEESIARAHATMAKALPRLLTIIVPRHPHRGVEVAEMLASRGLRVARRDAGERIGSETDIYVADTLGELGLFYRLAPVAFVGGSLIAHGGQNPIEPVGLGTAVLHGPHVQNFHQVYEALDAALPMGQVADADALARQAQALLGDPDLRKQYVSTAQAALEPFGGALDRTVDALHPLLANRRAVDAERLEPVR
ncbi:3-deoxy-D-manno-octulosonic acid transferase [Bauldia sp.]|uniref:3-deoxy-D-manno-octulosonic acid transferase n=1 Tax=Bauldia sp. TaxID=2575872 RepID=UPI003BAB1809